MINIKNNKATITCDICGIILVDNIDESILKDIFPSKLCKECEIKQKLYESRESSEVQPRKT